MEQFVEGRRGTPVFLGVDTHSDAHVAAALDGAGKLMGGISVPNTEAGYAELLGWASRFGDLVKAGVEGTGSYGAGLSRFLRARSVRVVVEVNRTSRQHRRRYGKHDASDAEAAAGGRRPCRHGRHRLGRAQGRRRGRGVAARPARRPSLGGEGQDAGGQPDARPALHRP